MNYHIPATLPSRRLWRITGAILISGYLMVSYGWIVVDTLFITDIINSDFEGIMRLLLLGGLGWGSYRMLTALHRAWYQDKLVAILGASSILLLGFVLTVAISSTDCGLIGNFYSETGLQRSSAGCLCSGITLYSFNPWDALVGEYCLQWSFL